MTTDYSTGQEGFERHHVQEKLQFYNVAHASTAEIRSLTYVIEDNYPRLAVDAVELRRAIRYRNEYDSDFDRDLPF